MRRGQGRTAREDPAQRMPKLLTPVNIGDFVLSHRVVTVVPAHDRGDARLADARHVAAGGLVIHPFPSAPFAATARGDAASPWPAFNAALRANGSTSIARLCGDAALDAPGDGDREALLAALGRWAALAQNAGFDGVELDVRQDDALREPGFLPDIVQALGQLWSPERVGVRLDPFAWMGTRQDVQSAAACAGTLAALEDMEVSYVHIAGAFTSGRGDLSTSPLGRHLRKAFSGMLVASGDYTPADALAVVEGRWADAVGFTMMLSDGAGLMTAVSNAAGLHPGRRVP